MILLGLSVPKGSSLPPNHQKETLGVSVNTIPLANFRTRNLKYSVSGPMGSRIQGPKTRECRREIGPFSRDLGPCQEPTDGLDLGAL